MTKCPQCGAEVNFGSKFCSECGAQIPQTKECPRCHAQLRPIVKFCSECGFSFLGRNPAGDSAVSMGDKNVVAGDVVGRKETYRISGDAVIVKNEDETKKMVRCHVCGRNMPIVESFKCTSCGEITCASCYVEAEKMCRECSSSAKRRKEDEYRTLLRKVYEDGKVEYGERMELNALKKKLGLAEEKAEAIENEFRRIGLRTSSLSLVERCLLKEAEENLFGKNLPNEALKVLKPVYDSHPYDEDVLAVYLPALAMAQRKEYDRFLSECKIDSLSVELSRIDLKLREKDMSVERLISSALAKWPENSQLKLRQVVCYLMVYNRLERQAFLEKAVEEFSAIEPGANVLENSWYDFASAFLALYVKDGEIVRSHKTNICKSLADGVYLNIPVRRYCIVDLRAGTNAMNYPITYMDEPPQGGFNTEEYKMSKLVLRRIDAGSFIMGDENDFDNPPRSVTLTQPFYCGIFQVTQKQYELVMGVNPSKYKGEARPVEYVSYDMIRGGKIGAQWPLSSTVDSTSFMGRLRARTGLNFDLPTEAQWEYACRAGTTSAYNNGGNDKNDLKQLGRYLGNLSDGRGGYSEHTVVGSYKPSAWGLYDMHGNVLEWCLDWYEDRLGESAQTDPVGPASGVNHVVRGGSFDIFASSCHSAFRHRGKPGKGFDSNGFRLCCSVGLRG